jgi:hypothetical protein
MNLLYLLRKFPKKLLGPRIIKLGFEIICRLFQAVNARQNSEVYLIDIIETQIYQNLFIQLPMYIRE